MKKTLCILAAFLLLAGTIARQHNRLRAVRAENRALNTNIGTLLEGVRIYETRDSLHAAGVGTLEVQAAEYRRLRQADTRLIEELKIRLKRVEEVSLHAAESRYRIAAPVRDTVFLDRERPDTARRFAYRSPHIDLHGTLRNDSVELALTSYDTLLQVVHRIPKHFLFIRYGTKAIRQEIVSKNPHTEITYTEHIRLRK